MDKSGFMYYKTRQVIGRQVGDKMNWICFDRKRFKCLGKATTEGLYIVKKVANHNHASTQKHSRQKLEQNIPVFFYK